MVWTYRNTGICVIILNQAYDNGSTNPLGCVTYVLVYCAERAGFVEMRVTNHRKRLFRIRWAWIRPRKRRSLNIVESLSIELAKSVHLSKQQLKAYDHRIFFSFRYTPRSALSALISCQ